MKWSLKSFEVSLWGNIHRKWKSLIPWFQLFKMYIMYNFIEQNFNIACIVTEMLMVA